MIETYHCKVMRMRGDSIVIIVVAGVFAATICLSGLQASVCLVGCPRNKSSRLVSYLRGTLGRRYRLIFPAHNKTPICSKEISMERFEHADAEVSTLTGICCIIMADEKSVMAVIRAARPNFRNNPDKVAFAVHASFLAAGFVLNSTGPEAFSQNALSSPSTEEVGVDNWNQNEDTYAFVYMNPDKGSKKVLVKCLVMNGKLLLDALPADSSQLLHLEIDIGEYVREDGINISEQYQNMGKLVNSLNKVVLTPLLGSSTTPSTSNATSSERGDEPRQNRNDTGSQPHPSGVVVPPVPPFVGSDVHPGPVAGVYPRGGFGDGSMLLGPGDPRWFDGTFQPFGSPGGQPGVPPGARFDPYGPPGVPGFEPGRFVRNRRPRGGGCIHPDLEHFGGGSDFI